MALRVSEEEFRAFLQRQGKSISVSVPKPPQKRSKYGNSKVYADGMTFDSKGEYARYNELMLQEKAGLIADLKRQVRIPIVVNGVKICDYQADFVYWEKGVEVVEDFKGVRTAVYSLKKKLLAATSGREILETNKRK